MVGLDHQNGFPKVSALVCMVTHWTRPMVNHKTIKWLWPHQAASFYCLSTLRKYWVCAKVNSGIDLKIISWSYIPMDWVTIDGIR